MTPFALSRDVNSFNGFGLQFADNKYSATIAQSTDTTLTIPGDAPMGRVNNVTINKYIAIFSYEPGAQVWVCNGATAAVPAGATISIGSRITDDQFLNDNIVQIKKWDTPLPAATALSLSTL